LELQPCQDEFVSFFAEYQDYLAPRLAVYEQAVYLYIARHTIAVGKREATIGFKSARKKMAFGVGKAGTAPSEGVIYEKLKSLESKGCVKVLSSERLGTRLAIIPHREIPELIQASHQHESTPLEDVDFFDVPENRCLILEREENRCFYCLAKLDKNNHVIEHVISRPSGNNSYKNVVAACRQCNNRKNSMLAEDFLRMIYREGLLTADEFIGRQGHLERLSSGELKPKL
jgi:hypothetical protein